MRARSTACRFELVHARAAYPRDRCYERRRLRVHALIDMHVCVHRSHLSSSCALCDACSNLPDANASAAGMVMAPARERSNRLVTEISKAAGPRSGVEMGRTRGPMLVALLSCLCAQDPPAEPSGCSARSGSGIKPGGGGSSSWARGSPPPSSSAVAAASAAAPPRLQLGLAPCLLSRVAFRSLSGSHSPVLRTQTFWPGAFATFGARRDRCARLR